MAVNLKELSKWPERLSGGHRLCSGCGASIAVRQILLGTQDPVVTACATGCLEVATTIYPYTAWEVPFIHNAFENVAATMSGIETAYRALKKKGKIKKNIKFIAFGGDGGSYDIGLQALSGALERFHNLVYICYDNQAYMNCLSTDSLIMCKDGLKKIIEVKVGDEVYAFNQKTHRLVMKKCSGVFNNGIKDVYELQTLHHSIKATSNHPFLVVKRNGKGRKNTLAWKTLAELKEGDQVIALKSLNEGKSYKFNFEKTKIGDYKVTSLNEINIPEKSKPDIMKYLGIYVGDGWTRTERAGVGLQTMDVTVEKIHAQTEEKDLNEYFTIENITNIKLVGKEPTLDLRVEDEHNFIADGIVVHNTGVQRSGATPCGASTTTAPSGIVSYGKIQERKDLTAICAAHKIPYAAQGSISHWKDLITKSQKAFAVEGPAFLNVLSICHRGWYIPQETSVSIAKLGVDTCFWPLYEIENGEKYTINYKPKEKKPITEFLKPQGRFKHLFKPKNVEVLKQIQAQVNHRWELLLKKEEFSKNL